MTQRYPNWIVAGAASASALLLVAIVVYEVQPGGNQLAGVGTAILVAGGGVLTGSLIGLLFGIPRSLQQASGEAGAAVTLVPEAAPRASSRYRPNTNLEDISDWLTKIIVGVGLTQFGEIQQQAQRVVAYLAPGLGSDASATAFVAGLLMFSTLAGFFSGYLLARLYLPRALLAADISVVARIEKVISQQAADDELAIMVSRQLAGPPEPVPSQEELSAAVQAASPNAREQAFWRGREYRMQFWRTEPSKVERVAPIFRALIASDPKELMHRYWSELAYSLKDRPAPDNSGAITVLTKAIEIRDKMQEVNLAWRWFEFNRAMVRMRVDLATGEAPSSEASKQLIVADLRRAVENPGIAELVAQASMTNGNVQPANKDVQTWLLRNDVAFADLS
jgi:hypothetical protein